MNRFFFIIINIIKIEDIDVNKIWCVVIGMWVPKLSEIQFLCQLMFNKLTLMRIALNSIIIICIFFALFLSSFSVLRKLYVFYSYFNLYPLWWNLTVTWCQGKHQMSFDKKCVDKMKKKKKANLYLSKKYTKISFPISFEVRKMKENKKFVYIFSFLSYICSIFLSTTTSFSALMQIQFRRVI